jgi:hypothetical protein
MVRCRDAYLSYTRSQTVKDYQVAIARTSASFIIEVESTCFGVLVRLGKRDCRMWRRGTNLWRRRPQHGRLRERSGTLDRDARFTAEAHAAQCRR